MWRGCRALVFLGTERSPEVCPWPLPRAGWVTVLEPGSSRGGMGGHESLPGGFEEEAGPREGACWVGSHVGAVALVLPPVR